MEKRLYNSQQPSYNKMVGVKRIVRKRTSKTPEGKVKDQVRSRLDELVNCWYYMPVQNGMGQAGIPDFIGCVNGKFFAIETKSVHSSHKLTAMQDRVLKEISAANGIALVINETNLDLLDQLL